MDSSIQQIVREITSGFGFGEVSKVIIIFLTFIYIILDRIYKHNNSIFYNIPSSYFKLNDFRSIITNLVLSLLGVYTLIILFSVCLYQFYILFFILVLLTILLTVMIIFIALGIIYVDDSKNISKQAISYKRNNSVRVILIVFAYLIILLFIFYIFTIFNKSFINTIQYALLGFTILNVILLLIKYIFKINTLVYNKIFNGYQIIYFTLVCLLLVSMLSAFTNSNKILTELSKKQNMYEEKITANDKDKSGMNSSEVNKKTQIGKDNISKYIAKEVKNSNEWEFNIWIKRFKNPNLIIDSYEDKIEVNNYNLYLENADIEDELTSTIRLLLILNLMHSYIIVFAIVLAVAILIFVYGLSITNNYFDPSRKKTYEYIVDSSGLRQFIITDYNDKLLVMTELKGNNGKLNLMLDSSRYKLISLTNDDTIYQEKFDKVNNYDDVTDEESNTTKTPDAQFKKSIVRDASSQIGSDKEYKPVTFNFNGGTKDGKVLENITKKILVGAKLSDAVETIDTIGVFKTIENSVKGFKKWASAENSSVEYEDVVIDDDYEPITLYAQYNKKLVKVVDNDKEAPDDGYKFVIFDFNGGTKDGEELELVKKEVLIGAKLSDAVSSVKTFGAFKMIGISKKGFSIWTDIKDDVEEYDDVIIDDKFETKTLYAYYDKEVVRDVDIDKYF